jgi:hypothetical protein
VETFAISPSSTACTLGGPGLTPVPGSATELDSTAIGFAQPPNNKSFLILMGPNPESANTMITQGSEFQTLSIDPQTSFITDLQSNAAIPQRGDSFAMDPQGRYYVTGTQDNLLEFASSSSSELVETHFSAISSCLNTTTPMASGSTAREHFSMSPLPISPVPPASARG